MSLDAYLEKLRTTHEAMIEKIERPPIRFPFEPELERGEAFLARPFEGIVHELRAVEATRWFKLRESLVKLRRGRPPAPTLPTEPRATVWMPDYRVWAEEVDVVPHHEIPMIRAAIDAMKTQPEIGIFVVGPGEIEGLSEQVYSRYKVGPEALNCEWVMILNAGDRLPRHALFCFANAVSERPEIQLVYADNDELDADRARCNPNFKPDWNEPLLRSTDYIGSPVMVRPNRLMSGGGWDPDGLSPDEVVHLPFVLLHEKPRAVPQATVKSFPDAKPLVSIIIPTRDRVDLLRACIESVHQRTEYPDYEFVIVDNGSTESDAVGYLAELEKQDGVQVVRDPSPFNYSELNNQGAFHAKGEVLCLLNNDIEAIDPNWMEQLCAWALSPGTGAVGPRLLYADGTIQHAGIVLGLSQTFALHSFHGTPDKEGGYRGRAHLDQWVTAVTGACLFIRKALFEELGGLDAEVFPVTYNDIDLCLKARMAGYQNVYAGSVALTHHESKTRGEDDTPEKWNVHLHATGTIARRWGAGYYDPFYNPNLKLSYPSYQLTYCPRTHRPWYR